MKINKNYNLYSIELTQGKRMLIYNEHLFMAIYRYKGEEKRVDITVDRWFKALEKWHCLTFDGIDDKCIAPTIHTEIF